MKWFDHLLSTRAMALLLLLMASAVGVATFIENSYDTITAKVLIYNAKWFELILFLLLINFINNIKTYQLLKWKKWSILLLHIGFIIALIGAFITRYVGFEGVMLIQENTSSQQIYSSEPWLQIAVHNEKKQIEVTKQHYFSEVNTSFPSVEFDFPNVGQVEIVLDLSHSSYCRIINSVNSGPFNEPNTSNPKENQMMSKDESLVVRVIPFKFKFPSLNY